jgi:tetraacyldisaccharide 4'-kinase
MKAPRFWYRPAGLASAALAPLSRLWRAAGAARTRRAIPYVSALPVLCVGNLTAGGAGKTPLCLALADILEKTGRRVVFLSRGHGGRLAGPVVVDPALHRAAEVGDEPLLLARRAPCVVARDRAAGARLIEKAWPGRVIVMDDGFQNPGLAKTLSLLAVDGEAGFGNGRVIPAGPLREPVEEGLGRARGAVLIGGEAERGRLEARLPVFPARLELDPAALERLGSARLIAFAGIGRPDKFFSALPEDRVIESHGFPDHHPYSAAELARLRARAEATGAALVTTEKDFVRLPEGAGVAALPARLVFGGDAEARLAALLAGGLDG